MQFKVLREHTGDRFYKTGDIREVDEMSVHHLVRNGVLLPIHDAENSASSSSDPAANVSGDGEGQAENTATESKAEDGKPEHSETAPEDKPDVKAEAEKPEGRKAESADIQNKAQRAAPKNKGQ